MNSVSFSDADDVPQEHALFVFDMKEYTKIPEAGMTPARTEVDNILGDAFTRCGIDGVDAVAGGIKDRGDGAIYVLPARHTARLIDPLLSHLAEALQQRERTRPAGAPSIRLRVSVHIGTLQPPNHDGDAANYVCRLVDSEAARAAMAAAVDHRLMLAAVVSSAAFDRSVRAERTRTLQPHHFQSTTALVKNKPGFQETCWLHVPGLVPAVITPYLTGGDEGTGSDGPAVRPDSAGEQDKPGTGAVQQKGRASGRARFVQVGRDYITGPKRE